MQNIAPYKRAACAAVPPVNKLQVYEYDRNLLQQDAVQYIAAYKYELGTILAALNMSQFVRARPRVCDKHAQTPGQQQQRSVAARGAAALLPKPGKAHGAISRGGSSSSGGGLPAAAGGFSMRSVLSAVSRSVEGPAPDKQQQRQQQQRSSPSSLPRSGGGRWDEDDG
jgi:hypothetical protein